MRVLCTGIQLVSVPLLKCPHPPLMESKKNINNTIKVIEEGRGERGEGRGERGGYDECQAVLPLPLVDM